MDRGDFWSSPSNTEKDINYQHASKARPKHLARKFRIPNNFPGNDFEDGVYHTSGSNVPYPTGPIEFNPPPLEDTGKNTVPLYDNFGNLYETQSLAKGFGTNPIVADMALRYGTTLMDSGKDIVDKELNKYVSLGKIRTYFDVDAIYAAKKLFTIIFPFGNQTWLPINVDGPTSPIDDPNAPDLYIPLMAYLTYVLLAGLVIAVKTEFRPEILGLLASQALACVLLEVIVQLFTIYVTNLQTHFNTYDLLAFSGYKFVGLVFILGFRWLFEKTGYYLALLYFGVTLSFFLLRTLKWRMIFESIKYDEKERECHSLRIVYQGKRRLYLLISIALSQPILMIWLSNNLESQLTVSN